MKVTYDSKIDAMYIYLNPKKRGITRTEEMDSGWIADYEGTKLIGIEILDASKVLGSKLRLKRAEIPSIAVAHRIR